MPERHCPTCGSEVRVGGEAKGPGGTRYYVSVSNELNEQLVDLMARIAEDAHVVYEESDVEGGARLSGVFVPKDEWSALVSIIGS